ncbi:type IV pilus twitching motility protein PilT [Desulfoscipio gibsoniae]
MHINNLLKQALDRGASDLHIIVGVAPLLRINGELTSLKFPPLTADNTRELARQILNKEKLNVLEQLGEVDLSAEYQGLGYFRVNVYYQRGTVGIACRVLSNRIPTIEELKLPDSIKALARYTRGLVIITGPTGSGKSTTLAAMINLINEETLCHVITLEDPIEYRHDNKKSIINQREIGRDSKSFPGALRAALRQDPDVILVGEMRDLETISIAITAAETGHLVLTTLHTMDAPQTVERIIDVFPPNQQQQIRVQLANTLVGVVSQRLLRNSNGQGRIPAVEVLVCTPAVRNLIREKKIHQIYSYMQTGGKFGMQTMDSHLLELHGGGLVNTKDVIEHAVDLEAMLRCLSCQQR